jgi:hypothetical protein
MCKCNTFGSKKVLDRISIIRIESETLMHAVKEGNLRIGITMDEEDVRLLQVACRLARRQPSTVVVPFLEPLLAGLRELDLNDRKAVEEYLKKAKP